ncbi:HDIG domain-containing metalloprotein [Anaeromicropila populeti]|uniref:HDIG domain-containing protein n=1 Tax=Anaeromicropila populeti TaxID=37658 RepID=A0A1I6KYX6_9FIRM|nr:HDIG domain-containing metalloprotein [Anaeromicropila populeti]SFR96198.1 HDIG domain-containing protein [Anaeromicropila populeti]
MIQFGKKIGFPSFEVFAVLSAMVSILIFWGMNFIFKSSDEMVWKVIFWNILMLFLFLFSIGLQQYERFFQGTFFTVNLICYSTTLLLIVMSKDFLIFYFWMIGSIIIACYIHPYLAAAFHLQHTITYCIINQYNLDQFVFYFLLGFVMIVVAGYMINLKYFAGGVAAVWIVNITLLLIARRFIVKYTEEDIFSLISGFFIMLIAFLIKKDSVNGQEEVSNRLISALVQPDHPLLVQFKKKSPSLYAHCVMVGELSEKAAQQIGADGALAKYGGFYHEIGRLKGNNYAVTTKESAIVMLSDSILASVQYLKENNRWEPSMAHKLVSEIMEMRFKNGTLDKSMLTLFDYKVLKEFYSKNILEDV